jgi:hypothetical protein
VVAGVAGKAWCHRRRRPRERQGDGGRGERSGATAKERCGNPRCGEKRWLSKETIAGAWDGKEKGERRKEKKKPGPRPSCPFVEEFARGGDGGFVTASAAALGLDRHDPPGMQKLRAWPLILRRSCCCSTGSLCSAALRVMRAAAPFAAILEGSG